MQNIFNKPYYQEDFNKYILSKLKYNLEYYETFFDATTLILYNKIAHRKLNCNDKTNQRIMKNFIYFEEKIKYLIKNYKFKQSEIEHFNKLLNKTVFIQQEKKSIETCMKLEKGE